MLKITSRFLLVFLLSGLSCQTLFSQGNSEIQPEFSNFSSPDTETLVDKFTGSFQYSIPVLEIPGPNGSGYSLSLSYQAGNSPQQEASWVGYGWTLNPGTIVRNKRGYADDVKDAPVSIINKIPASRTFTLYTSVGAEILGQDLSLLNLGVTAGYRYNNRTGGSSFNSINANMLRTLNVNYSTNAGEKSLNISYDIWSGFKNSLTAEKEGKGDAGKKPKESVNPGQVFLKSIQAPLLFNTNRLEYRVPSASSNTYNGKSIGFRIGLSVDPVAAPIGINTGLYGGYEEIFYDTIKNHKSFGYIYSSLASSKDLMDFYFENDQPYSYRETRFPIPFSNADIFNCSGNAIGGTFRFHSSTVGSFSVNKESSQIFQADREIQLHVGMDIGVGATDEYASRRLLESPWNINALKFPGTDNTDLYRNMFLKFSNDKGGNVIYDKDNEVLSARIVRANNNNPDPVPNIGSPELPNDVMRKFTASYNNRKGSSSIFYHLNIDIANKDLRCYTRGPLRNSFITRSTSDVSNQIGEIVVYNNEGNRYQYSLPVYSRNEYDLEIGADPGRQKIHDGYLATITGIPFTPSFNPSRLQDSLIKDRGLHTVTGTINKTPYASLWLLTSVTTPDYIDLTDNGPSDDDLGGWTKFAYERMHGSNDKSANNTTWYTWRQPYCGFLYKKNKISDPNDDRSIVSGGEKEIYYLDTIETKTHIALFIRYDRQDGLCAAPFHEASASLKANGNKKLQYLERIELYAKDIQSEDPYTNKKLIRTTRFQYDYSTFNGIPDSDLDIGRLTLRKVWFEYEDIQEMQVSPYEFYYEYDQTPDHEKYPAELLQKYQEVIQYPKQFAGHEKPRYQPFIIDRWGNYCNETTARQAYSSSYEWVTQDRAADRPFDPAAWQLKRIILPTGGAYEVQYEANEYEYVRDKEALIMARLKGGNDITSRQDTFFINLQAMGIKRSNTQLIHSLKDKLHDYFINKDNKIYFKFLYTITSGIPSVDNRCAEYIDGMANVKEVKVLNDSILFILLKRNSGDVATPFELCRDFAKTGLVSKINANSTCTMQEMDDHDTEAMVRDFINQLSDFYQSENWCARLNLNESYLRIPSVLPKLGGGVRVKRILMYDEGLEDAKEGAVLLGTEYLYQTADGKSSGVATNEPGTGRMENALVDFLPKKQRNVSDRLVGGVDKDQSIGYIGETILPGASVGYSSIFEKNIHSGKTSTGIVQEEFYTAKDETIEVKEKRGDKKIYDPDDILPLPVITISKDELSVCHGYSFIRTQLHGQSKAVSSYNGSWDGKTPFSQNTLLSLVNKTEYEYFKNGDSIPVLKNLGDPLTYMPLGKEMEINLAGRSTEENIMGGLLSTETTLGFLSFIPIPWGIPYPGYKDISTIYRHHTISKVVTYPAIVKKVKIFKDGMKGGYEHIAFSDQNGAPVLIKSTDGFDGVQFAQNPTKHDGSLLNYTQIGGETYPALQSKSVNEDQKIQVLGKLENYSPYQSLLTILGDPACTSGWSRGDLLMLNGTMPYYIDQINGRQIYLNPHSGNQPPRQNIERAEITLEIIRSAKNNQVNLPIEKWQFYGIDLPKVRSGTDASNLQALENTLNQRLAELFRNGRAQTVPLSPVKLSDGRNCLPISKTNPPSIKLQSYGTDVTSRRLSLLVENFVPSSKNKCRDTLPVNGDSRFEIDKTQGLLKYYESGNDCQGTVFACLQFCPATKTADNVLSAEAITYTESNFEYYTSLRPEASAYETGKQNRWSPFSSYVYKSDILPGSNSPVNSLRIYNKAGTFNNAQLYNHFVPMANDTSKWLRATTNRLRDQQGNIVETTDVFHLPSSTKYGYNSILPVLVAQNATSEEVYFESFETRYSVLDNWLTGIATEAFDNSVAHSGSSSLKLPMTSNYSTVTIPPNIKMENKKAIISLWVRFNRYDNIRGSINTMKLVSNQGNQQVSFALIAQVGEWCLVQCQTTLRNQETYKLSFTPSANLYSQVWIDDFRIQPEEAAMKAYVYDPATFRLVTEFDDQHFGLYYQYNAKGQLIRKLVETERGKKTISEAHYNIPKKTITE